MLLYLYKLFYNTACFLTWPGWPCPMAARRGQAIVREWVRTDRKKSAKIETLHICWWDGLKVIPISLKCQRYMTLPSPNIYWSYIIFVNFFLSVHGEIAARLSVYKHAIAALYWPLTHTVSTYNTIYILYHNGELRHR